MWESTAVTISERFQERISELRVPSESGSARFTVSVGVTSAKADDTSFEQAIGRADAALYEAKAAGRNRTCQA